MSKAANITRYMKKLKTLVRKRASEMIRGDGKRLMICQNTVGGKKKKENDKKGKQNHLARYLSGINCH